MHEYARVEHVFIKKKKTDTEQSWCVSFIALHGTIDANAYGTMTSEYCSFPWDRPVWNLRESVCIASIEQKHQKNIHCNWNDPKRMRHRRILWFMVILYVSIWMQIYNILRVNNNTNKNKTRIHKVSTRLFVGSLAHNYSPVINSSETFFYLKNSGDQIRPIGKRSNCVEFENVHSDSVKNRHWMCR